MATCSKEKAAASRKSWNNQGKWRHATTSQSKITTLVALIIQCIHQFKFNSHNCPCNAHDLIGPYPNSPRLILASIPLLALIGCCYLICKWLWSSPYSWPQIEQGRHSLRVQNFKIWIRTHSHHTRRIRFSNLLANPAGNNNWFHVLQLPWLFSSKMNWSQSTITINWLGYTPKSWSHSWLSSSNFNIRLPWEKKIPVQTKLLCKPTQSFWSALEARQNICCSDKMKMLARQDCYQTGLTSTRKGLFTSCSEKLIKNWQCLACIYHSSTEQCVTRWHTIDLRTNFFLINHALQCPSNSSDTIQNTEHGVASFPITYDE